MPPLGNGAQPANPQTIKRRDFNRNPSALGIRPLELQGGTGTRLVATKMAVAKSRSDP